MVDRMLNYKRMILVTLGLIFSLAVLSIVYIHLSYGIKMPREPQPQAGRIFQISVNHGTLVYVTKEELDRAKFVFRSMPYVGLFCFAAFGLITIYIKDP
jgi:ammonia channel protein AmtB